MNSFLQRSLLVGRHTNRLELQLQMRTVPGLKRRR